MRKGIKRALDVGGKYGQAFEGYDPLEKEVTFANTNADVDLFTVTGFVSIKLIVVCETNVESSGGANLAVGITGTLNAIIGVTDCTDLEAGDIWHDNSPDSSIESLAAMRNYLIANGLDIVLDVETAKQVDSGVLTFYLWWAPLSDDGKVVVA